MYQKCDTGERLDSAKQYCLKLLGIRERTKLELTTRLKEKKYAIDIIASAIRDLSATGLIDDKKFAHSWIERRLINNYGKNRIAFELKQKGIPEAIITQELNNALSSYDESGAAAEESEKYKRLYRNLKPEVLQRRLYGHLIRKGFSSDIVQNIVNHYDDERNS